MERNQVVRVLGSLVLALSLLLPVSIAPAQEQPAEPKPEQSLDEASREVVEEQEEDLAGGALKERRGIEEGRPLPESWTEILETRAKLQIVKQRWEKTHWLNDKRRTRARNSARRMTILTLEIEQNAELEELVVIKVHRAGQLLRWRLGQVVALMGTEGTLMLDEIVGNVDLDLHNFYDHTPTGLLGPKGLPPVSGTEPPAEKPAQAPETLAE
jgi:hypothetical protein